VTTSSSIIAVTNTRSWDRSNSKDSLLGCVRADDSNEAMKKVLVSQWSRCPRLFLGLCNGFGDLNFVAYGGYSCR